MAVAAAVVAVFTVSAQQQPAPPPTQQPAEIAARITGDPGAPPRMAVPDFVALTPNAAELARTLAQVLWDDLAFEREFYLIPRDTYKTIPAARTPAQIAFASWRELGADAVVFGTVDQTGDNVRVQVRVFNVRSQQQVFGEEYESTVRNARRIAHTVSDVIHLQQRNLVGVGRTKLAFVSNRQRQSVLGTVQARDAKEIFISDYDGANPQQITTTRHLNVKPSWSGDARSIVYANYRDIEPNLFVSHLSTGVLQQLTKGQRTNWLAEYSPDGKRIAFASNRDGNLEIYVMNVDGSGVRRLTNHPDADNAPTWSPSGNQIAFTSDRFSPGRPSAIFIMNADGTGARRLPLPDSQVDRPTWAPAPYNEIAYSGWTGSGWDIKAYDLSTQEARQITHGEGSNESPVYSPTGRHLAFQSSRGGGRFQIYTVGRDGVGLRQITREGENTWPDWSPTPAQ